MSYRTVHFLVLSIILFVSFFAVTSFASAARPISDLKGWAWSSNTGWISMSCENQGTCATRKYGVSVNQETGALTGHAWSDNVGWLQFGGLSSFPTGSSTVAANATLTEQNTLTGWARFCAGTTAGVCNNTMTSRTDGWDGWVSLSGKTLAGDSYGIRLQSNNQNFENFAWGSDVVGWISFSQVISQSSNVAVTLTANPESVSKGGKTNLTWKPVNAVSCTSYSSTNNSGWQNGGVRGFADPSYTKESGVINEDTLFTINCLGSNGSSATSSVTVDTGGCGSGGCGNSCDSTSLPSDGNYTICSNGGVGDYSKVLNCTTAPSANACTYTTNPVIHNCVFPDSEEPVTQGKIYYKASIISATDPDPVCRGKVLYCDADGVLNYPDYKYPTCRVSPVIRPI